MTLFVVIIGLLSLTLNNFFLLSFLLSFCEFCYLNSSENTQNQYHNFFTINYWPFFFIHLIYYRICSHCPTIIFKKKKEKNKESVPYMNSCQPVHISPCSFVQNSFYFFSEISRYLITIQSPHCSMDFSSWLEYYRTNSKTMTNSTISLFGIIESTINPIPFL
jgi:hypothetical protein